MTVLDRRKEEGSLVLVRAGDMNDGWAVEPKERMLPSLPRDKTILCQVKALVSAAASV